MELQLHRTYDDAMWKLYEHSFPRFERRDKARHKEILSDQRFLPYHLMDNGESLGLLYCWSYGDSVFVEHFATLPQLRGQGHGAVAIEILKGLHSHKVVVLEVEPPVDEMSIRRKGFYERLGFRANSYEHIHPSYSTPPFYFDLLVMSYPRLISQEEFDEFRTFSLSIL